MSFSLFGRKKPAAPAAPSPADTTKTIAELNQKLQMLEKRQAFVEQKAEKCLADAKARSARKDKKGALMALKRKKMHEKEAERYMGARMTLEQQINMLESASVQVATFSGMKQANAAMKGIHSQLKTEDVEDAMDDIAESMQDHEDIGAALGAPLGGAGLDDEDLMAELGEMEAEMAGEELLGVPSVPAGVSAPAGAVAAPSAAAPVSAPLAGLSLPSAPTATPSVPVAARTEEEDELAALEAEMA